MRTDCTNKKKSRMMKKAGGGQGYTWALLADVLLHCNMQTGTQVRNSAAKLLHSCMCVACCIPSAARQGQPLQWWR